MNKTRALCFSCFALLLVLMFPALAAACPKGQFSVFVQDPANPHNECRECPSGYKREPQTGKGHSKKECIRVENTKATKLSKEKGGVGPICKKGFWNTPDDRCYECPTPKTHRSERYAHDITKTATTDGVCTRTLRKEPIVLSTTGFDDVCRAAMRDSLPSKDKAPPPWVAAAMAALKAEIQTVGADVKPLIEQAVPKEPKQQFTDFLRSVEALEKNATKVMTDVFEPTAMCSPKTALAELNKLGLKTKLPFFLTVTYTYSGSMLVGGQYGAMLVTNLTPENTKFYRFVGASVGADLGSLGISLGVQGYFEKKSVDEFDGFGLGLGFSGGSPWGPGAGIDASVAWPLDLDPSLAVEGFGPNLNGNLSISPVPVSAGLTGTYVLEAI